jgi:YfiH family protein
MWVMSRAVSVNRQKLEMAWGVKPVFLQQVHGIDVVQLKSSQLAHLPPADACFTDEKNVACTIMVADCLPVLFYWPQAQVVAAAHAGWKGLALGVLEATLDRAAPQTDIDDCKVWLGPCIGPHHFEVGDDVRNAFCGSDSLSADAFLKTSKNGKYLADLAWLARRRLNLRGIAQVEGNDSRPNWCTYSQPELYYSHRRDGVSGRFAAGIALV